MLSGGHGTDFSGGRGRDRAVTVFSLVAGLRPAQARSYGDITWLAVGPAAQAGKQPPACMDVSFSCHFSGRVMHAFP